jgi:hypothetical protein
MGGKTMKADEDYHDAFEGGRSFFWSDLLIVAAIAVTAIVWLWLEIQP